MYENGEVFYRAIPENQLDDLIKTGKIQAGTETFTSPTLEYIKQKGYEGIVIKFRMKRGTLDELIKIGVRNDTGDKMMMHFPNMERVKKGWSTENALFKTEGKNLNIEQVNIGLGNGKALKLFNDNIVKFEIIK